MLKYNRWEYKIRENEGGFIMVKMKKIIALGLAAVLTMTAIPNLSETVAYAADTAWSVLSEKDIVLDDIYNLENNIVIGRKDGKIATLDDKLNLIQQSEYDQIEDLYAKAGYLVSKKTGTQTDYGVLNTETGKITPLFSGDFDNVEMFYSHEYCYKVKKGNKFGLISWETGKTMVPLCYVSIDSLRDESNTGAVFAAKDDGTSGFVCNGKEIGFDTRVSAKDGLLYATSITLDSEVYYVKEFFENEDVFDDMGHLWSDSNLDYFKKDLESYLTKEKCKLVFYDQEGTAYEGSYILDKINDITAQRETILSKVKEQAQTDAADFISKAYEDPDVAVDKVVVKPFGSVNVACVSVTGVVVSEDYSGNLLGVYDGSGKLLQFGFALKGYDIYDVEEDGWDANVLLKNMKKQIFYCNESGEMKLIFTDNEDKFCYDYYKTDVYDYSIELYGKNNVLLANPENDFVKVGSQVYSEVYGRISDYYLDKILLVNDKEEKTLFFYNSNYDQVESVDLSFMKPDLCVRETNEGLLLTDSNWVVFVDGNRKVEKNSLNENSDFSIDCVDSIFKMAGVNYAYIKKDTTHAVYRISDQTKMMEKSAGISEIQDGYCIDGVNVLIYRDTYYGLMDVNGNIIVNAKTSKYERYREGPALTQEDQDNGIRNYIYFMDEDDNKYYYYGTDMSVHTEKKNLGRGSDDYGTFYGNVTYYKNYLEDGGLEETIYDSKGNLLATYKTKKSELQENGYRHLFIFTECRSIVSVKKNWDGKRKENSKVIKQPVNPTQVPGNTTYPTRNVTSISQNAFPSSSQSDKQQIDKTKNLSKPVPARAQFKKIKNVKGRELKITLKAAKNASGYQIAYAAGKSFKKKSTVTSKKLAVTLKKLKKKTYYVKVRAFVTQDGKKVYGKWSSVKKVKIKK